MARRSGSLVVIVALVATCAAPGSSGSPGSNPTVTADSTWLPSGAPTAPPSGGPPGLPTPGASPSSTAAPSGGPSGLPTPGRTASPVLTPTPGPTAAPSGGPPGLPTPGRTASPVLTPTPGSTASGSIELAWTRHFGTAAEDLARGITVDSGGITIVGDTSGSLDGSLGGASDAFIRRYDFSGGLLWGHQVGTNGQDWAQRVVADAAGITLLGATDGSFSGGSGSPGAGKDLFVRRYDRLGGTAWTRQMATAMDEDAGGIAADDGGVIAVGTTRQPLSDSAVLTPPGAEALVLRYGRDGTLLWTLQFGSVEDDQAHAVGIDAGGFVVGGGTDGDLQGKNAGPFTDAYLRRYDNQRQVLWTRQWGQQGDDAVLDLAVDATGITAVGYTHAEAYGEQPSQAFIRRYDLAGSLLWDRIFGSPDSEIAWGISADGEALTVTGYTYGSLDGPWAGSFDVFVRRYNRAGALLWRTQFGTPGGEIGVGIAGDPVGFTILGHTNGALGGASLGELDLFLRRYSR